MDGWISVEEQLPEKDGRYLVVEGLDYHWIVINSTMQGKFDYNITHWQPLPEPPTEESEKCK